MATLKITSRSDRSPEEELLQPAEAKLQAVNGRATTYTLDASTVRWFALKVEKRLADGGVTKRNLIGTVVTFTPGGPGSAYARKGHDFITTSVKLRYVTDGWRLVSAEKASRRSDSNELLHIRISEAAQNDMLRRTFEDITVHTAAA
ncbi:hypothetical protein [Limimaricola soesokkakensis]|uniref:hypothetical protein n=1 Tax=Limimaricola soesokkakensis TaxID=1343159 RepID=UPI003511D037